MWLYNPHSCAKSYWLHYFAWKVTGNSSTVIYQILLHTLNSTQLGEMKIENTGNHGILSISWLFPKKEALARWPLVTALSYTNKITNNKFHFRWGKLFMAKIKEWTAIGLMVLIQLFCILWTFIVIVYMRWTSVHSECGEENDLIFWPPWFFISFYLAESCINSPRWAV